MLVSQEMDDDGQKESKAHFNKAPSKGGASLKEVFLTFYLCSLFSLGQPGQPQVQVEFPSPWCRQDPDKAHGICRYMIHVNVNTYIHTYIIYKYINIVPSLLFQKTTSNCGKTVQNTCSIGRSTLQRNWQ